MFKEDKIIFKKYEAIFFDLFHTLTSVEVSKAPGKYTHEILGISQSVWNDRFLNGADDFLLGKTRGPLKSYRKIVHSINPSISDKTIREAGLTRRKRFAYALRHIEAETLQGLKDLKELGLKLGLISNAGYEEIKAWEKSPLVSLFDTAVFSCCVGLKKPDPEIFRLAARLLQVRPEKSLFVGDGGSDEHTGAKKAGMTTVLLTRHLEVIQPEKISSLTAKTDFQVRHVRDILKLLD